MRARADLSAVEAKIAEELSRFGSRATSKLVPGFGQPEAQIRGPVEELVRRFGALLGIKVQAFDEVALANIASRPDFAIHVGGALVGHLELKAPGRRIPDTWQRPGKHNKEQWERLSVLPNLLYTDGQEWGLYRCGKLVGSVGRLKPDLATAGRRLAAADSAFGTVIHDFLTWSPQRPRTIRELVRAVAGLCRLLRNEVQDAVKDERTGKLNDRPMLGLARDWRELLFPTLDDDRFADAYAQTVTFALLLARQEGVDFTDADVGRIARFLGKKHLLLGKALEVLTADYGRPRGGVAVDTLLRVIGAVEWSGLPEGAYLELYEQFLEEYDPALRRKSGSYYTPSPLAAFVTRFVDDILRERLRIHRGFADESVIAVDPAMGTGTFLEQIVERSAATISREEGPGAVPGRLRALTRRLVGFEKQAAPFAVAELRLHGILHRHEVEIPEEEYRFLADTLDNPELQVEALGSFYEAIARSRRGANRVKQETPVMVVLSNPPYLDKAKGLASWIEKRGNNDKRPALDAFRAVRLGRLEYVLSNLYVYFWRWATWKVFDAHAESPAGVVAFISSAGYIAGPGFAGMRRYLRETTDEGWIIDLTPEGHQPPMLNRFFPGNQQPLCIGIFVRQGTKDVTTPALVHYTAVHGTREDKIKQFDAIRLDGERWVACRSGWEEPLLPVSDTRWESYPALTDLLPWAAPGVKPNRTWVYSSDPNCLRRRWRRLVDAEQEEKSVLFKESGDGHLDRVPPPVPGFVYRPSPFRQEDGSCPTPVRVGYRSFDRQWVIPDSRLHDRARPDLWGLAGLRQVFISEQHAHAVTAGPALVFSALVPDMDHFQGHHGGRVLPAFRTADTDVTNTAPGLLHHLSRAFGRLAGVEDLVAYVAAVTAHPAFTELFRPGLAHGGVRIPLTAEADVWEAAVELGRRVVWLHTYGERFVDTDRGRHAGVPKLAADQQPKLVRALAATADDLPDRLEYLPDERALLVGRGRIEPVPAEVFDYEVSGMRIVAKWFNYRCARPRGRRGSPLDDIRPEWSDRTTGELLELLNVLGLCVALEPEQAAILERVLSGRLIDVDDLSQAAVLPVPKPARQPPTRQGTPDLWQQ